MPPRTGARAPKVIEARAPEIGRRAPTVIAEREAAIAADRGPSSATTDADRGPSGAMTDAMTDVMTVATTAPRR